MRSVRRDAWLAAGLAALAGLRVFAFASAFPFFNGIDEHQHFDAVQKYSRGFLPGPAPAGFDAVSARLIVDHASPEYLKGPEAYADGRIPAPAEVRAERATDSERERLALQSVTRRMNFEADGPPGYYALAGAWLRLGRSLGLDGLRLLYWVRWLTPFFAAGMVLIAWALLRRVHAEDRFLQLGPLVLIAAWPNDLLYGITPDGLAALLGAICFAALARLAEGRLDAVRAGLTGLAIAAAFLTKYPGVVFAAIAAAICARQLGRGRSAEGPSLSGRARVCLWLAAALPALWWLERNVRVLGSLSGQERKMALFGWSWLTPAQWLEHPLLGLRGWSEFLPVLARVWWSGEVAWHGRAASLPAVDAVYVSTTAIFLALAMGHWLVRAERRPAPRVLETLAIAICAASVALLAALSLLFDYGLDEGPLSRAFPYFASGRLVAGALVPFAVLYCRGIATAWALAPSRLGAAGSWGTLGALAVTAVVSEAIAARTAFASGWNWWHLE